jgi:hypothetical protein
MNFIPDPPVPTLSDLARNRAQLLQAIAFRPDARRRRRRVTAGVAAVVLLGGATAGAVAITATPMETAHTAYCYSAANTESRFTQVAGADQSPLSTNEGFLDACGAVWRSGFFTTYEPGASSMNNAFTVPELGICLGRNDVVSIFPIGEGMNQAELCRTLGLREAPAKG